MDSRTGVVPSALLLVRDYEGAAVARNSSVKSHEDGGIHA